MRSSICILLLLSFCGVAQSSDWPQFRFDHQRSAYSPAEWPGELELEWIMVHSGKPEPAWPRSQRMTFDHVFRPVIKDGILYWGQSHDGAVVAFDMKSGRYLWKKFTEGPVRFAPLATPSGLFVISDDGFLYKYDLKTGAELKKLRGGPSNELNLGNGRLISRWPARGGPVFDGQHVYFAAGIWPTEGVSIFSLDPKSNETVWLNDRTGSLYIGQPHGGAYANSGVAAQGYLTLNQNQLFVSTGRAVPAVFDKRTGKLGYFHLQKYGHYGGSLISASSGVFLNQGRAFKSSDGLRIAGPFTKDEFFVRDNQVFQRTQKELHRMGISELESVDRKGKKSKQVGLKANPIPRKELPLVLQGAPTAIIGVGKAAVYSVGEKIYAESTETHDLLWQSEFLNSSKSKGIIKDLIFGEGRLIASTDEGVFFCFTKGKKRERKVESVTLYQEPPRSISTPSWADSHLENLLKLHKQKAGYAIVTGTDALEVARSLARNSDLRIHIGYERPPSIYSAKSSSEIEEIKNQLVREGLYGSRIRVHYGQRFPDRIADWVFIAQEELPDQKTIDRQIQWARPHGGLIYQISEKKATLVKKRQGLPGEGTWTHQYADAGNSSCSRDDYVKGPMRLSWYRDIPQKVPQRHGRAPAPLYSKGKIFSVGIDRLIAVDAYNGRMLWERKYPGILKAYDGDHLMGTAGSGSNYCLNEESLYLRIDDRCDRIRISDGQLLRRINIPPIESNKPIEGPWGYISSVGDILLGTVADPKHVVTYRYLKGGDLKGQLTESKRLFALDRKTGKLKWQYVAKESIRHNSIAASKDYVFLIDRKQASFDRKRGQKPDKSHTEGLLVALRASDGKELWSEKRDIYGTLLIYAPQSDALLMGYQNTRFKLASEIGGRFTVFKASTGSKHWEKSGLKYKTRPLVIGSTIYSEGGAWDLISGEEREFNFKRSYGCGQLAAGAHTLLYRSATLGYFDLEKNNKNVDFGGIRPGCWINALPVGGMVLVPEASSGCVCSYLNQGWIALQPVGR